MSDRNKRNKRNKRLLALCGFAVLLAVEIIIGKFAQGFIRAYVGDVLVIPLIYCFVRMFYVRPSVWLPAAVGCLGIFAEILQFLIPDKRKTSFGLKSAMG